MHKIEGFRKIVVAAVVALSAVGCGGGTTTSPEVVKERPIKQVGEVYRNFSRDAKKPPKSTADFKRYAQLAPAGCQVIQDGSVEVFWGVTLSDLGDAPSSDSAEEVLAYEKQVPTEGGSVLMKNRAVRTMTADEFKAAPKAGTISSAAPVGGKAK